HPLLLILPSSALENRLTPSSLWHPFKYWNTATLTPLCCFFPPSGHLFRTAGDQPCNLSTVSSAFPMVSHPVFGLHTASSGHTEFGGLGSLGTPIALAAHPQLTTFPGKQNGGGMQMCTPVLALRFSHHYLESLLCLPLLPKIMILLHSIPGPQEKVHEEVWRKVSSE
uniref:Uncharacterized protein n=1 Tax=Laticauda laticaudata TaxID=8630 RepID=A0A8C5SFF4_LATLA